MKKLLVFAVALLLCIAIMSPVLAEYGYTSVSKIPMAVDFTLRTISRKKYRWYTHLTKTIRLSVMPITVATTP